MVFSYWFVLSYKNIKKIFTFWHTCLLFILKNACYSETKYYLCKQNNKRSLLGRKQRSRVARSFPNRYLFGLCDKVTSLFSTSCILDIILRCKRASFTLQKSTFYFAVMNSLYNKGAYMGNYLLVRLLLLVRYSPSNLSFLPLLPYV